MIKFEVIDTFTVDSRKCFVIVGNIVSGTIKPEMSIGTDSWKLPIAGVEYVDKMVDGKMHGFIGLMVKYDSKTELDSYKKHNLVNHVFKIYEKEISKKSARYMYSPDEPTYIIFDSLVIANSIIRFSGVNTRDKLRVGKNYSLIEEGKKNYPVSAKYLGTNKGKKELQLISGTIIHIKKGERVILREEKEKEQKRKH